MNADIERQKYEGIYSSPQHYPHYGHTNHGARALPILQEWDCRSLLDVGCGFNEFVAVARSSIPGVDAVGIDFACPGADIRACATNLPFEDKAFDVVTAFDVLEHLLPQQVAPALNEFARVSQRFIFSIAYVPSRILWKGMNLHPTVESEEWWLAQIVDAGGSAIIKHDFYITGTWKPVAFWR